MNPDYDYIVVGAGIAGLGAAYILKKQGHSVLVLESQETPGGRMKTETEGGRIYEPGAGFILPHFTNIHELAKELGCRIIPIPKTKKFTFLIGDKRYFFDLAKDPHSNFALFHPETLKEILTTQLLSRKTKFRILMNAGSIYAKALKLSKRSSQELSYEHDLSTYSFFRNHLGKDFADNIIDPIIYGAFTYPAKEMSANLVLTNLTSLVKTQYLTFEGGIGELTKRLAAQTDVSFSSKVQKICESKEYSTVEVQFTTPSGIEKKTAAKVIVAVQGSQVLSLLEEPKKYVKDFFGKVRYSTTARVFCTRKVDSFDRTNQFIISESASSKIASVLVKRNVHGTSEIEAVLRKEFAQNVLSKNDVDLMVEIREDLSRILQTDFTIDRIHRWSPSLPIFYPGYLEAVADFKSQISSEDRILFAGDYLEGPFTEAALRSGLAVGRDGYIT